MFNRLLFVFLMFGLCSCQSVEPWERGTLARQEMQLESDRLGAQLANLVYFSKEASTGGNSPAGGGCGCN